MTKSKNLSEMTTDHAFIIDWFQYSPKLEEIHALAVQLDELTGLYVKCLIRIEFPDFAYILFGESPEAALINRARRAISGGTLGASMRFDKVKTISGYQPTPTVPALLIRASDMSAVMKEPSIKALGGFVEEHTVISRSRKLTALRSMSQCCWVPLAGMIVMGETDKARISKPSIREYRVTSWDKFEGMTLDSFEAFIPPPSSGVRVASFDIEVYKPSKRGGGMPNPDDQSNFILCISVVVHEKSILGGERREVILHTIYDVAKPEEYVPDGTRIHRYATEYEMIRGFWENIAEIDPVLILGFNVQSWDYRYINSRMKLHGITYPSALSIYQRPVEKIAMRHAHWSSDAFKNNDMFWPDIPGMVTLDLHKFYSRSRPSLRKHSLDYISRNYLGRGKFPVSQNRMVLAYETGDPEELSAMAQYNIEDSMLVLDLFLTQNIFEEVALEALTSETLIDDLYTKGMQVRALNKIYRYAKEDGYVVTTSPALSIARGQGGGGGESRLVGASVQGSNPGRYDNVAVYDIRSMYPTLLMSHNVCYTTFLPDINDKSPDHNVYPWETKSGGAGEGESKSHDKHEAAFVTTKVHKGLCTRLLSDQVILRDKIRSWDGDSMDKVGILKYIQRGVKMVSNSIIGLMGSVFDNSRLSFPAAAGVVYTAARSSIGEIIRDVTQWNEEPHGMVVYSDTDSVLVAGMAEKSGRNKLLTYLNEKYYPFIFELETVGRLLLVGPKNYIMRLNADGSLVYKGVDFSKRNASDYVAQSMQEITAMIMDKNHSKPDILKYLKSRIQAVKSEDLDSFVMSATVSLASQSVGGKLGRRLIAGGAILMPGDVVDYVIITKPISEACGFKGSKPLEYTKTGTLKKTKAAGVTDRTATVEEIVACFGPNTVEGPGVSIDFEYYTDKLKSSTERLLVFD